MMNTKSSKQAQDERLQKLEEWKKMKQGSKSSSIKTSTAGNVMKTSVVMAKKPVEPSQQPLLPRRSIKSVSGLVSRKPASTFPSLTSRPAVPGLDKLPLKNETVETGCNAQNIIIPNLVEDHGPDATIVKIEEARDEPITIFNEELKNVAESMPNPILTLQDAMEAADANNQVLSRSLFTALKGTVPIKEFQALDGKMWSIDGTQATRYEFWSSWSKQEEIWLDVLKAIDILNDASDYIILQEDLLKLREDLSLLEMRFGEKYLNAAKEDDEEDRLEIHEPPSSKYLEHDIPNIDDGDESFTLLSKPEPIGKEEKAGKETIDLVNMLSDLNIVEEEEHVVEVKIEPGLGLDNCSMSPPRKVKSSHLKPKIGVPVGDEGSTVTVLTPIRAKNRLKKDLGVDKVITPVRRSLRFHDDEDYISKSAVKKTQDQENQHVNSPLAATDTKSKVKELLEEHGFAFVPNENVNFKMNMM